MDWQELTNLTKGEPFVVERVRLTANDIVVEGEFEPPQLAQLSIEDQVFVTAFVRCHGSIKEMERTFGVSYPTIKARLNRISQHLDFVDSVETVDGDETGSSNEGGSSNRNASDIGHRPSRGDVIDRLSRGEITTQDALRELKRPT